MDPYAMNSLYPSQRQGQIDPALIQQILALNAQKTQEGQLQQQLARAQALRAQGQKGAQQMTYGNGNIAAPNWAGAIANVLAARKASQMEGDAATQQQGMSTARQDALRRYFEAMTSQRGYSAEDQ